MKNDPAPARAALQGLDEFARVGEAIAGAIRLEKWITDPPGRRRSLEAAFRGFASEFNVTASLDVRPGLVLTHEDWKAVDSGATDSGVWLNEAHLQESDPTEAIRALAWWFRSYHRGRILADEVPHPHDGSHPEHAKKEREVWLDATSRHFQIWESDPEFEDSSRFSSDIVLGYWRWIALNPAGQSLRLRTPASISATLGAQLARVAPPEKWCAASNDGRKGVVDEAAAFFRDQLELTHGQVALPIEWIDGGECGWFDTTTKQIALNERRLCSDPTIVLLDTLPHEISHARMQADIDDGAWRGAPSPYAEPFDPASVDHAGTRYLAGADGAYDEKDYAGHGYSYNAVELEAEGFAKRITEDYWRAAAYTLLSRGT